jgi:dTDP-4-amino-4,6-dideoxygalactose transaminase
MLHHPSTTNRYVIPDMPSADELLPYLRQIDANRWYSNFGPLVTQFEDRLTLHLTTPEDAAANGKLHLTTLTTCYHALQIGLQLFRLPPNAKVLIPAMTFPACPLAVQHAGAEPVLADVDEETWQLTPAIARRIAAKTPVHAVMPVAVYGVPVPTKEWDTFSEETGIPVIIDAAAALDAQSIPKHGLIAFSLHATKPFSVGEGGVLAGRRPDWIEEARRIANFGTHLRITQRDGSNAKMSEYHGAVALAQLDRWPDIKQRRQKMFAEYRHIIESMGLRLSFQTNIEKAIASVLMLRTEEPCATRVINSLNAQGIAAHSMYLPPLYRHPHFANLAVANGSGEILQGNSPIEAKMTLMKQCEALQQTLFGVPFHAFLNGHDMDAVVRATANAMGHAFTTRTSQTR